MSRLCLLGGDLPAAIAYAFSAVRTDRENADARAARETALAQRPDPVLAQRRFEEALALEPRITAYAECYGSAPAFESTQRLRALLEEAVRLDPAHASAQASLANVLARDNHVLLAIAAYRRSLDVDPQQPDAALALSELLFNLDEMSASEAYRAQALAQKRFYPAGADSANASVRVLVLNAPGAWAQNTPLEFMIDPRAAALDRLYLTADPIDAALPPYDVVFNAIGEAERAHDALARAERFITQQKKPALNQPAHLWKTARPHLADALKGVFGCVVPRTQRIAREELASCTQFPLLARPIDTHAGRGLERLDDAAGATAYLARYPDDRFDAVPFVDYRSADGYYRKYRVVLVDGVPFAYHLAISPEWMVHYIKTPTASVDWMRAEEERFLREPRAVFAHWERTFTDVAGALGLDYAGVDCALMPDGNVLVFEADAALLVHCREPAESYKHQYVPRIFRAVEALLSRSAAR